MRLGRAAILILAGVILAAPAHADDVSDQINQALTAYRKHDTRTALEAVDKAANLLRQQRADQLKTLLPPAPPGWTADPAETSAVSAAMLGGGTTASRSYHRSGEKVDVQLTTDSPMLQGMAALADSPLAASSGTETVMVSGQRMAYTARDNGFMSLIGKRVILKVNGNPQTPEADLRTFLSVMNFTALEKMAR